MCLYISLLLHLYVFPGILNYLSFVLAFIIENFPNNSVRSVILSAFYRGRRRGWQSPQPIHSGAGVLPILVGWLSQLLGWLYSEKEHILGRWWCSAGVTQSFDLHQVHEEEDGCRKSQRAPNQWRFYKKMDGRPATLANIQLPIGAKQPLSSLRTFAHAVLLPRMLFSALHVPGSSSSFRSPLPFPPQRASPVTLHLYFPGLLKALLPREAPSSLREAVSWRLPRPHAKKPWAVHLTRSSDWSIPVGGPSLGARRRHPKPLQKYRK